MQVVYERCCGIDVHNTAVFKGVVYEPRLTAAHENVAVIDDANLDCFGKCRAAIFEGDIMHKGRIFHLEDEAEWIGHIQKLLGKNHDLYSAASLPQAARLFQELHDDGLKFDVAIIDISLIQYDAHDSQGFRFIDALEESGVLPGHNIIVLTAYPNVDENMRRAFRDYVVRDVFDKIRFPEERRDLAKLIEEIIESEHSEA